jgi:drug/metabolite transporter (DMT)-like permease
MIISYLLLVLMISLWSFSFVIVDISVEFIPPISVAFYRFLIVSIFYLLMDTYRKLKKPYKKKQIDFQESQNDYTRKEWLLLILSSISGVSLFFFSQYQSINLIGPSLPALFVCLLSPVVIALLALIFFKEKLNNYKILGFIIATIGGFLLVTGGDISMLAPDSPNFLGYFFALLTPILWAIYSTLTKQIKSRSNLDMIKMISYFGTFELFIFVLISGELPIFLKNAFNPLLILCEIYLGLGCYVIGFFIWQTSQRKMDSSKVASFLYIEPFLTLLFSFLLQREETIVLWNIIGGIIVLCAVLLVNYAPPK